MKINAEVSTVQPALIDYLWVTANPYTWIFPAAGFFLGIWVWHDAGDKTDYAAVWGILTMLCFPVFFPLYYFALFAHSRTPRTRHMAEEMEMKRMPQVLGKTAMDREYMLAKLTEGPGTVFDPQSGMSRKMGGHRYRELATAEDLQVTDPQGAWDYLTDLYETSELENDTETIATCEWYMRRLPDGDKRFTHWLKHRHDPPPEDEEAEAAAGSA
ncbi:hypothetical protein KDL29_07890 [bacterium]|nr:hypothetical protein [bacterium]